MCGEQELGALRFGWQGCSRHRTVKDLGHCCPVKSKGLGALLVMLSSWSCSGWWLSFAHPLTACPQLLNLVHRTHT